jgi:hypothetical protein
MSGICGWCQIPLAAKADKTVADHIIPASRGGPDTRWNRQLLHWSCNAEKGDRLTAEARNLAAQHNITLYEPRGPRVALRTENFKYNQVAASVRRSISGGKLAPGASVPSARQLAQEHGVSLEVCRKALRLLAADEVIVKISAGLPFYVAEHQAGE